MPETTSSDTKQRSLVIVESPAKARTIARFLGPEFAVESSIGHIRDLPRSAKEVPPAYRTEAWAKRWGVDVDNDFKPLYVVPTEKKPQVTKLKSLLKEASEVYLATDEDLAAVYQVWGGYSYGRAGMGVAAPEVTMTMRWPAACCCAHWRTNSTMWARFRRSDPPVNTLVPNFTTNVWLPFIVFLPCVMMRRRVQRSL